MKAAKTRALHRKHAGTSKHHSSAKHTPTAHRRGATAHKQVARRTATQVKAAHARALTGDVSCCVAEALAASLRHAGRAVEPQDVLALYRHTADSPGAGASILATLEAVSAHGLKGERPEWFGERHLDDVPLPWEQRLWRVEYPDLDEVGDDLGEVPGVGHALVHARQHTSLILGLELPEGPHAVMLDPAGDVWSWGELYELGHEAVIEEAWAVTWP